MRQTTYRVGEVVNLAIPGARYAGDAPGYRLLTGTGLNGEPYELRLPYGADSYTITRVAPAEWPPQAGDVWTDRDDCDWSAVDIDPANGRVRLMFACDAGGGHEVPEAVSAQHGPMRLAYRRGWAPTELEPEADDAGEVDERAAGIAGLRALAAFLETHPDVPMPQDLTVQYSILHWSMDGKLSEAGRIAEAGRVAAMLGVELDDHLTGVRDFGGGAQYRVHTYRDAPKPAPTPTPADDDEDLRDAKPVVAAPHDGHPVGRDAAFAGRHEEDRVYEDTALGAGAICACGESYEGFATLVEASDLLNKHIERANAK